jgi:hypothetical protein
VTTWTHTSHELTDYYKKYQNELVDGKAPKRPDRRKLNWLENKKEKAQKEKQQRRRKIRRTTSEHEKHKKAAVQRRSS